MDAMGDVFLFCWGLGRALGCFIFRDAEISHPHISEKMPSFGEIEKDSRILDQLGRQD